MSRIAGLLCFIIASFSAFAHVGSPGVVMEGSAGPYKVLVSVTPPDVIPGVSKVSVYLQNGPADLVTARAVYFRSGDEGAPVAENMKGVAGQPGQYTADVWLMSSGSSSIQITIQGKLGKGVIVVPVVAVSTAVKKMPASTGMVLSGLGIFLFVLMVTIIGSSVSDALTKAGQEVPARRKKIRLAGIGIAILLTSLGVFAGNAWWKSWAADYTKFAFKPMQAVSTITRVNGANQLVFSLDTSSQRVGSFSFIIPDHGKLMHMFVMRMPSMDAFAHLHPVRIDSAHYKTILPALPGGKYLVFADIVYTSGFTETIKDTFNVPVSLTDTLHKMDRDDAYAFAVPASVEGSPQTAGREDAIVCGQPGTGVRLKDGSTMVWEEMTNEPFETGKLYQLTFSLLTPDKQMARLEPYLGMTGHAAIIRNDGNVYIHLHPVGTFSMAAESNLLKRIADSKGLYKYPAPEHFRDSIDRYMSYLSGLTEGEREKVLMTNMGMAEHTSSGSQMVHDNVVKFPYSFPSPGQYRIWVQVKRNGQVLTGAFDKIVK